MRKLVFYSDQSCKGNERIDAKLLNFVEKTNASVAYIPSCGDKDQKYFRKNCEYYERLGISKFFFFDLNEEVGLRDVRELLSCNIIHLSAGDPLVFIQNLKRRKFIPVLREFSDQGGVLAGVSGGSLQLTKTVAVYKTFVCGLDQLTFDDYIGLSALDLVDFEFLPHVNRWNDEFLNTVKAYSAKFSSVIYACRDGDGIVVHDNEVEFIGKIMKIQDGKISELDPENDKMFEN